MREESGERERTACHQEHGRRVQQEGQEESATLPVADCRRQGRPGRTMPPLSVAPLAPPVSSRPTQNKTTSYFILFY